MSIKTSRKTYISVRFTQVNFTNNTSAFHFTPKSIAKLKKKKRKFCMKKLSLFCIVTLLSWQLNTFIVQQILICGVLTILQHHSNKSSFFCKTEMKICRKMCFTVMTRMSQKYPEPNKVHFIYIKCCFLFYWDLGLKWSDQTANSSDFVRFCSSIQSHIWRKSHD